jgi:hypothetical protein
VPSSGTVFFVPKGAANPYGEIKVVCIGNSVSGTAQTLDSTYSRTDTSLSDPRIDIVFTKGATSTEYVYMCSNGVAVGGQVVPEQP